MTINENAATFDGRPVADFDAATGIEDAQGTVYRLRIDYDMAENYGKSPETAPAPGFFRKLFAKKDAAAPAGDAEAPRFASAFDEMFHAFISDPNAADVTALVIGDWGHSGMGESAAGVVGAVTKASPMLANLHHLFVGDIMVEEAEVSWIEQSDMSPLWSAYPELETFRVRGGNSLSLGRMDLPQLKTLIVETGGLPKEVLDQACNAQLPELEHMELWLGDSGYGWDGSVSQLQPVLTGARFPKLKYLGLRDSEEADDVAIAVAGSAILPALEVLDLSLGTLTDKGVDALVAAPGTAELKKLDIHHHYVSDEGVAKLWALGCEVDASDRQEEDSDEDGVYRYVAVSE